MNEQLWLLWLTVDDGLYLLRRWGAFADVNDIGCELLGYTRSELLARNVLDVQDGVDAGDWDAVWESLAPGTARSMDAVARRKDGTRVPVHIRMTPIKSGTHVLMLALVRDVSARREADAELSRRAEQQAVVAQLGRRAVAGADAASLTRDAVGAVVRMLGVESAEVITSTSTATATSPAGAGGLSATIEEGNGRAGTLGVYAPGRALSAHESDFVQAVANVVGAALAREREEQLRSQVQRLRQLQTTAVRTAHDLKNLLGVVLNYGGFAVETASGQPELSADLAEILQAAERAAALAGSLELQATELSGGDRAIDAPEPAPVGLGETILVVEDEEAVRRVTTQILSESGYEILAAASFEAAASVWAMHGATIDLLLTDAVLGRRSGADLADVVWQTAPELPVLFISADTTDVPIRRGSEHRMAMVEKPLGSESLLRSVGAALEGRS